MRLARWLRRLAATNFCLTTGRAQIGEGEAESLATSTMVSGEGACAAYYNYGRLVEIG